MEAQSSAQQGVGGDDNNLPTTGMQTQVHRYNQKGVWIYVAVRRVCHVSVGAGLS